MRTTILIVILILVVLNFGGYAEDYIIGPGDVLSISVWKDENLTKDYTVDKDGIISMQYLKEVKVSELTTQRAADFIAGRLQKEGFLVNPVVSITVKEYRSQRIMVFGKIKKPGPYYLKGKTMVLDLLTQLEYDDKEGTGKLVILRKRDSGQEDSLTVDLAALVLNGDLTQNIEILGGDKVILSPRTSKGQQIYVLGEINNPGPYTIERDMTVLEAIRLAGGFTDFANKSKVKIIREKDGKKKDIYINLNKIRKGDKSQDINLVGGDVLVALKSWL
jgi:polysaccharide export outer membrane protein